MELKKLGIAALAAAAFTMAAPKADIGSLVSFYSRNQAYAHEVKKEEVQKFEQVGTFGEGELIMKLPGANFRLPYHKGDAFVNKTGDVGYTVLEIYDISATKVELPDAYEKLGESDGFMLGKGARMLADKVNEPEYIKKRKGKSEIVYLLMSRTTDGKIILTLPTIIGNASLNISKEGVVQKSVDFIDEEIDENTVVNRYKLDSSKYTLAKVIKQHVAFIEDYGTEIASDKESLKGDVLQLAPLANAAYEGLLNQYVAADLAMIAIKSIFNPGAEPDIIVIDR